MQVRVCSAPARGVRVHRNLPTWRHSAGRARCRSKSRSRKAGRYITETNRPVRRIDVPARHCRTGPQMCRSATPLTARCRRHAATRVSNRSTPDGRTGSTRTIPKTCSSGNTIASHMPLCPRHWWPPTPGSGGPARCVPYHRSGRQIPKNLHIEEVLCPHKSRPAAEAVRPRPRRVLP